MNIIVHGADGHMGRILTKVIEDRDGTEAAALISPRGDAGNSEFTTPDKCPADALNSADVVIDFSHHSTTSSLLDLCTAHNIPLVLCTTGQTAEENAMIETAADKIPIFRSANMSVGVALTAKIVREVAARFDRCDVEILEAHHNRKVDAPSGTAMMLADAVRDSRSELAICCGRSGNRRRESDEIGINSIRMGNIAGMHEVMFGTDNQTITIKHEAHDRALFADGAIDAAAFIIGKPAGLYNMDDLLG